MGVGALILALGGCGGGDAPAPTSGTPSSVSESVDALPPGVQARSLSGELLTAPALPPDVEEARQADLAEALAELEANPGDPDALIWVGRRQAYLGEYRDAIETFSQGVEAFPQDPRFYRHRGHRWITVREFQRAVDDFRQGVELIRGTPDEVEPDGMPNPSGIPTSTLQFNIWYHLGLAHYLRGEFEEALEAYESCMEVSTNPDAQVATSYWLYLTLGRLNRDQDAAAVLESIRADMDILENQAYHDLLLLYKGERSPDDLLGPQDGEGSLQATTAAYGVAMYHHLRGESELATSLRRRIVAEIDQWAAFGYIAAEADLEGR